MFPLVLGVITGRGQSKGVPNKNIREVLGIPLIAYTIWVALRSQLLARTIVSTDDENISNIAKRWGADVPFLRPHDLATDEVPHLPVLQHAINFVENQESRNYDYVFTFQPTAPLREVSDVDGAITKIVTTGCDSVIGLVRIEDHHPLRIKRIENDLIVPYGAPEPEGMRRQDLEPKAYIRAGSIYVARRDLVMNHGSIFGQDSRPWLLASDKGVSVDNEYDLMVLEHFIPRFFPKKMSY